MIYTLTMNTAIDLFIHLESFGFNTVNRSTYDELQPNGKGINVSLVLKMLEVPSTALGFIGGFTGEYIKQAIERKGITTNFITVEGDTRVNVFTHVDEANQEFKLVNRGPEIADLAQRQLMAIISQLSHDDLIIISGSLPRGIQPTFLVQMVRQLHSQGVRTVIDTSYPEVLETLSENPYLLKPNIEELEQWIGHDISDRAHAVIECQRLIDKGAKQILLSLGSEGALYVDQDQAYSVNAPAGKVINTACAGDTLLGTFLAQRLKGKSVAESLRYASAAGSSTAFSTGLTDFSDIDILLQQVKVTPISLTKEMEL
ncbi:MAG: 1-phosphofructokinase [Aerococcus sp.]|nr:1-phosphofructokinase [Aerococcus sp.]